MFLRAASALFLLLASVALAQDRPVVSRVGTLSHDPLGEVSGIACSDTYPDTYWVHNDSGDEARIFAVDSEGKIVFPEFRTDRYHGEEKIDKRKPWPGIRIKGASNIDWEDIAQADGQLFIADIGNNGNARRDLGIYVVNEPNPREISLARALRFMPVRYPEQQEFPPTTEWNYDAEALFVDGGKLYLLTRHRRTGEPLGMTTGTRLYRLDTAFTDRENLLTFVDARDDVNVVSAADLSPDGRKLAILTYATLWVFDRPGDGDAWLSGPAQRLDLPLGRTRQVEAVCWEDNATLRIANEQRDLFRVELSAFVSAAP